MKVFFENNEENNKDYDLEKQLTDMERLYKDDDDSKMMSTSANQVTFSDEEDSYQASSDALSTLDSEQLRAFSDTLSSIEASDDVDVDNDGDMQQQVELREPLTDLLKQSLNMAAEKDKTLSGLNINWHEVGNLPGYAFDPIRNMFKPLFDNYFSTPIEDIMLTNTMDPGTTVSSVKKLSGFIFNNGEKVGEFSLDYLNVDPSVTNVEKAYLYDYDGMRYLIGVEHLNGQKYAFIVVGQPKLHIQ